MSEFKVKRGETEFVPANFAELQQWVSNGRVIASDYVYNPTLSRWMYAREMEELKSSFPAVKSSNTLTTLGIGLLVVGFLLPLFRGGIACLLLGAICLIAGMVRKR